MFHDTNCTGCNLCHECEEPVEPDEPNYEGGHPEEGEGNTRLSQIMSNVIFTGFDSHVDRLSRARERRRETLAFKSALEAGVDDEASAEQTQDQIDGLGVRIESDEYNGDVNMRTLKKLLARIDARGFERCVARFCRFAARLAASVRHSLQQVVAAARVPRRVHEGGGESDLQGRMGNRPSYDHVEIRLGKMQFRSSDFNTEALRKNLQVDLPPPLLRSDAPQKDTTDRSPCLCAQHRNILCMSCDVVWHRDRRLQ